MAPEILLNNSCNSLKVDIWAAGVIFHQLLFGKLPFFEKTMLKLIETFEKLNKFKVDESEVTIK